MALDVTTPIQALVFAVGEAMDMDFYAMGQAEGLEVLTTPLLVFRVNPVEVTEHAPAKRDTTLMIPVDLIYIVDRAAGEVAEETVQSALATVADTARAFSSWPTLPANAINAGLVLVNVTGIKVGRGDDYGDAFASDDEPLAAGHVSVEMTVIQ